MKILTITASLRGGEGKVEIGGSNAEDRGEYTATVSDDGEDIMFDDDQNIPPKHESLARAVLRELI